MDARAVALAALLVLSGCITPFGADKADPTATPNATVDSDPGTEPPSDVAASSTNPWEKSTLTVSIVNAAGPWRDITPHVADALDYWERNDAVYGKYEVEYDLEPNASDPDLVVRYVEDVSVCGSPSRDRGVGIAPRITAANPPDPPESVCVRAGLNGASIRHLIKHEFGHVLGIRHGEAPVELMSPDYDYQEIPRPSPRLQTVSTDRDDISVYADRSTVFARRSQVAERQLDRVYEYYENGTSETIDRVNVTTVESRNAADVVITFPRQAPCDRPRAGSCATLGERPDGRPQLEVAITTTHEDTFGWHAGFWLGFALGANRHSDLPAPLRNASFDDRRGQWWTDRP